MSKKIGIYAKKYNNRLNIYPNQLAMKLMDNSDNFRRLKWFKSSDQIITQFNWLNFKTKTTMSRHKFKREQI